MNLKYLKAHVLFSESGSVMTIDLNTGKIDNYLFSRPIDTYHKTCDCCEIVFDAFDGSHGRYKGYVPRAFPGKHYGDYIAFSIDKDGTIQGFSITDEQIDELIAKSLP